MENLQDHMKNGQVAVTEKSESVWALILTFLTPIGILLIFIIFWIFMMGTANGQGGNKTMTFGKSKARMLNPTDKNRVMFDDVAGVDEEKEELIENGQNEQEAEENADQNYHSSSADRGLFLTAGRGIPEICSFYDPISGHRL